jgi:hypothetical protein
MQGEQTLDQDKSPVIFFPFRRFGYHLSVGEEMNSPEFVLGLHEHLMVLYLGILTKTPGVMFLFYR